MCINCIIKDLIHGAIGGGFVLGVYKLLSTWSSTTPAQQQVDQPKDIKKYIMINGKLKNLSDLNTDLNLNIYHTSCSMCSDHSRDYSITVYIREHKKYGDNVLYNRIFYNTGSDITTIFVCEGCRNTVIGMADEFSRSKLGKKIIVTYYDAKGNDTGIAVNYNKLKPDDSQLCPYPDVTACKYSPVCKHCNMCRTRYSIVISTDKCETGKYEQTFVCSDCHQKLVNAPGNIFPLDSDGFRLYNDINVSTYEHSLPVGAKIREHCNPLVKIADGKRMYPDIHNVSYPN